ncbi:neurocan core protein-like [Watersipora subatra]|uniref:neurocan core protein-like n=1 Tax=Watersipora subatra TaxID=2589382 RepID=UPI00355BE49F
MSSSDKRNSVLWHTCIASLLAQAFLYPNGIGATSGEIEYKNNKELCPQQLQGEVEEFQCRCYEFLNSKTYWDNNICATNGGHLAKIDTKEVDSFLRDRSRKYFSSELGVWIGAFRETEEDEFFWTDGSPLEFSNWADGEPDSIIAFSQNCVYLKEQHLWTWATLQCTALGLGPPLPSICQYEIDDCAVDEVINGGAINTTTLIVIIVCAGIGAILLLLIISCAIIKCRSRYKRYHKRKSQRRSVRYYSRPPSTVRQSVVEPRLLTETHEPEENDLNEKLVHGAEAAKGDELNVKGSTLPTASSIAAAATSGLVVDVHTGRSTVKRINTPAESKTLLEEADGSLKPADTLVDAEKVSISYSLDSNEENSAVTSNLDNMNKPSSNPSKDVTYK